jgi:hypothetical protein
MYYGNGYDYKRAGFRANPPVVEQAEAGRGLEIPRSGDQRVDLREK